MQKTPQSLPSTPISRTSSINSDDLSNLIENLVIEKFFDTLAHQKQRRLQRKIHKNQRFPMDSTDDDGVEQIGEVKSGDEMARKTVQLYHVMVQTSKALKLCESRKEWFGSLVHVEAERLLLFASVRREAILEELRKETQSEIVEPHTGTLKLTKLIFEPKHTTTNKKLWYLCLLKNGTNILCTDAVPNSKETTESIIEFNNKEFIFENLHAYFELEVCLYVFVAEKKVSKFFLCETDNCAALVPSFRIIGKTVIRIADLKKTNAKLPCGVISFKIETRVNIAENFKGFLTIGVEKRGLLTWNRRFCVLDGRELKYWNYPQELESDGAAAIEVFNLEKCATALVNRAERCVCARPRTLLLELYENSGIYTTILKRFLAADSKDEMKIWQQKINAVVLSLRNWCENQVVGCFNRCSEI